MKIIRNGFGLGSDMSSGDETSQGTREGSVKAPSPPQTGSVGAHVSEEYSPKQGLHSLKERFDTFGSLGTPEIPGVGPGLRETPGIIDSTLKDRLKEDIKERMRVAFDEDFKAKKGNISEGNGSFQDFRERTEEDDTLRRTEGGSEGDFEYSNKPFLQFSSSNLVITHSPHSPVLPPTPPSSAPLNQPCVGSTLASCLGNSNSSPELPSKHLQEVRTSPQQEIHTSTEQNPKSLPLTVSTSSSNIAVVPPSETSYSLSDITKEPVEDSS
ncbi:hypothetical protein Avbf_07799 [Armadillidium vulgare]|nr:hypothetical protein Avbf_07799 [Armadillidium vulgare]